MFSTLIKRYLSGICLLTCTAILFFSCQKELSNESGVMPGSGTPADLSSKVSSSVSGFVTDENNLAVNGATVQFGSSSGTSNKYGYFEFKNVDVVKNAAFVTVTKAGYFKGIKTYIATAGKSAFFRIKLMPKTNAGSINAGTGGNVTLSNGLVVALPANGVVNAATGAAYTGPVSVAARWIDPTAADLNETMPGDLRAINNDGALKGLTTYGMAAVELTGSAGELLQVATGKKASLTIPLPAALAASAPATIQLWYFDETKGLWKEEGTAIKTGNTYVCEVSHFSFWNCDVPDDYIWLSFTLLNSINQPMAFTLVKITEISNPNNYRIGYTNAQGYVTGQVPDNAQLLMEVFASNSCNTTSHSQTITTTGINLALGNIVVASSTASATVSGILLDCSNNPVTNGRVIAQFNNQYSVYHTGSNGAFSFDLLLCNSAPLVMTIIPEDLATIQQGNPTVRTILPGVNNLGNLQACGISAQQFVNYTINTLTNSFQYPVDSFYHYVNSQVLPLQAAVSVLGIGSGTTNVQHATINYAQQGIALNSIQDLKKFDASDISPDSLTITTPVGVNITEYGAVGQYISGNFTGVFTGKAPTNTIYNITCSFRVRRNQ